MQERENETNRLLEFIDRVKKRLNLNLFADMLIYGLIGGFAGWTAVNVFSLFVPVYNAEKYGAYLIIPCAIAAVVLFFLKRFGRREAALKADLTGLKERVTTAYENRGKDDTFSRIQRADALRTISRYDIKQNFPFRPGMKKIAVLLALVLAVVTTMLIPSSARAKAQTQHGVKVEAEKVKDKLEEKVKELKDTYHLTEEQMKELDELLEQAKKELKDALTEEDLTRAEERFAAKADQKLKKDLEENHANAGEAQKNVSLLEKQTDSEKQASLEAIKQQAENAGNMELKNAAEQAERELKDGQLSEEALQNLREAAQNGVQNAEQDLENAGIKPNNGTSSSSGNPVPSGTVEPSGTPAPTGDPADPSGAPSPTGDPSQGQQGQQGQGQQGQGQQGQGQQGQGQQGPGWNQGSDKGNEKDPSGKGERVFVPNQKSDETLHGKNGEGEESQTQTGQSFTWEGNYVDYGTVIGDYTRKAYEDLNDTDVPPSMQELIKDYFTEINK
ncbi:MAG: hypothetical protein J6113_05800 [Lachnospiraceae bacterium]|nr:hypothetical protein [Lachnospiraceae bacterium]